MEEQRIRRLGDFLAATIFIAVLIAPAGLALTGHAGFDTAFITATEHRRPFFAPAVTSGALATGGWERDLARQVADAFPLRTALIAAYDRAKFGWLHDSTSRDVIRGRDDWLFLGADERDYIEGTARPSDAELEAAANRLAAHARWCRQHGSAYLFVLAPNKSTIYPQFVGPGIAFVRPTPADRLMPLLRARGVRFVDPRAALVAAASRGPVYTRSDTHWNDAGAYVTYEAIVAALKSDGVTNAVPRSAIGVRVLPSSGDLLAFSGFPASVQEPWLHYTFTARARELPVAPGADALVDGSFVERTTTVSEPKLPTAVIFGDSFSGGLQLFLGESFRRAVFLRYADAPNIQFDAGAVLRERPAVVIQELVERDLGHAALLPR